MKKKFINGLLLVALFVGFTGSMVSCKDYDDDKIGNLEGILADKDADLRALLNAQKEALQKQIDALSKSLAECQQTCKTFREVTIPALLKEYVTIKQFNEFKDEVGNTYYTKLEINQNFYTKAQIDEMMKKFGNIYTKAEVDALLSSLEKKIQDAISDEAIANAIANQLKIGNKKLEDALAQYFLNNSVISEYLKNNAGISEERVKQLINEALVEVNNAIAEAAANAKTALDMATENQKNIATLTSDLSALTTTVNGLTTTVNELNTTVNNLETTVKNLSATVESLNTQVINLGTKLNEVQKTANEAKALAEANKAKVAALEDSYAILADKLDGVEGDVAALKVIAETTHKDLVTLAEVVDLALQEADAKHKEMLQTIAGLASAIDANTQTIGQLQADFAAYQEEMAEEIEALQGAIVYVYAEVLKNQQAIEKLQGLFKNTLAQYISGVEVNGTHNQLYGGFALPVGIRSNVLTAFHGQFGTRGVEFPTTDDAFYALPDAAQWETVDMLDLLMLNNGAYFNASNTPGFIDVDYDKEIVAQDGKEGNAGTLYVTINPSTTDFTGTEFQLFNSQNKQADVTLGPIVKSNHLLTNGYTRTDTPIGFYETKATVDETKVKNLRMNLNLSDLKDLVKELKDYRHSVPVLKIVTTVYKSLQNAMPALAAKATWTDDMGETKSFVSQYDLAAVAIKPLSFAFAKDFDLRGEIAPRVEDFLDNILNRVFAALPEIDTDKFFLDKIELDELTADLRAKFHLYLNPRYIVSSGPKSVTINIPDITLTGIHGEKYTFTIADPIVTVEITGNNAEIIVEYNVAEIGEHMGNYDSEPVANIMAQLKEFVADVNTFLAEINKLDSDTMQSNFKSELMDYFNSLANRATRLFEINRFMQPCMLVKTNGSYGRVSETANYPSKVYGTNFLLAPTTFNAEVLSPAYKKYVAVTNVSKGNDKAKGGNAVCKAILDKANAQPMMKQVIDGGTEKFIDFEGEKGYTYEILYMALDYHGKVFTKKFYLTIAE